jgi:hypothetical protein
MKLTIISWIKAHGKPLKLNFFAWLFFPTVLQSKMENQIDENENFVEDDNQVGDHNEDD